MGNPMEKLNALKDKLAGAKIAKEASKEGVSYAKEKKEMANGKPDTNADDKVSKKKPMPPFMRKKGGTF